MKLQCMFVMDEVHHPLLFGQDELARLQRDVDVLGPLTHPRAALADGATCARAQAIISSWGMPALTGELLAQLPRLQVVFHAAGTVRAIVTEASWERGIRITSAASENARPTAEFAFAEIVLSLKRAWPRIFAWRERQQFERNDPLLAGALGSTVGLLSLGKVGRLVARRLATLDVRVVAYDPLTAPEEASELGVELCSLEDVFARADVVSCHMPLTPQTEGVIRGPHFATMKPGAAFINTARGGLLNEAELAAVLQQRPDLFAVLDVLEFEPPRPECPLLRLPNVIITPHIAGSLGPECRRLGRMMVDEVGRYAAGRPLLGEVLRDHMAVLA